MAKVRLAPKRRFITPYEVGNFNVCRVAGNAGSSPCDEGEVSHLAGNRLNSWLLQQKGPQFDKKSIFRDILAKRLTQNRR